MADITSNFIFSLMTSFREVLEAALIIGIVFVYLAKINRRDLNKDVILGIIGAVIASIGLALFLAFIFQDQTEYQELFEGTIMLIAASVLSFMIIWMAKQSRGIKGELEDKIDQSISEGVRLGLFSMVFFAVFREGAELILLLSSKYYNTVNDLGFIPSVTSVAGGFLLGLLLSSVLAVLLFKSTINLNLKKFFNITSVILIILAAGLIAHGIHEIFEYLEASGSNLANLFIFNEAWNINNTALSGLFESLLGWMYDPKYPGRFEKSTIGLILTGLFGWNDNPSVIEAISYFGYYILMGTTYYYIKSKPTSPSTNLSQSSS